jgi:hypothetical protein
VKGKESLKPHGKFKEKTPIYEESNSCIIADGIIICHSNFTKSLFISRDRERDSKREPVLCGSLNSLRSLLLGFLKLRNQ